MRVVGHVRVRSRASSLGSSRAFDDLGDERVRNGGRIEAAFGRGLKHCGEEDRSHDGLDRNVEIVDLEVTG